MQNNVVSKRKNSDYLYYGSVVFIGLFFFLSTVVGFLFFQTRYLYKKVQTIVVLQEQYRNYCKNFKNKSDLEVEVFFDNINKDNIDKNGIDKNQDYWSIRGDNFIVVNRDPAYLKKSMISHLKKIKLENILSRININDWEDYSGKMPIECAIADNRAGNRANNRINNRASNRTNNVQNKKQGSPNRPTARLINRSTNQNRSKQVNRRPQIIRSPASSFFIWPIDRDKFWLSSFFGSLRKKANGSWYKHPGIDMAANKGTAVKAVAAGIVAESRYASGYGNMVLLHHGNVYGNTYKTRYAHLDKIFVKRGEHVQKGQVIGAVGETGRIRKRGKDGSHLHFEVYMYNKRINPLAILPVLV